ncbi:MAG: transporter substrate-binding domain-containing protein [Litorilinea sp.]
MKIRQLLIVLLGSVALVILAACAPVAAPTSGGEQPTAAQPCNEITPGEVDGAPDLQGCILRIAVENAYQPFNFIDPDTGEAVGYDYDVFGEICERVNCQTEFVETSWDAMVAVMGGEGSFETFDVAADGITITEERAQNVDFSLPYVTSSQVLLVRIDEDRFVEPEEFAADPELLIGTQLGTTNYDASLALVGEDRVIAYDQFGTAVQAVVNGDVDAVMIDNVAGIGYVGANSELLKVSGAAVESEELGFILGQGSPLVAPINYALESMDADGTLADLRIGWFEPEEEE